MTRVRVTRITRVTTSRVITVTAGARLFPRLLVLLLAARAILAPAGTACADTADYKAVAGFSQTTPYTTGGLTATPAATETLTGGGTNGLGVAGGGTSFHGFHGFDAIDQSEVTKLYA